MSRLNAMLGTKNPREQERRVDELIQRCTFPPVHIAVSFDPLTGNAAIQTIGGQVPADLVITALTTARDELLKKLAEARVQTPTGQ